MRSPSPNARASKIGFPRWSFAVATLLTLFVIGTLLLSYRGSLRVVTGFEERELALERACGDITWLDEVLTMSATMAAETGDPRWEIRYHEHVVLLDRAFEAACALAPGMSEASGSEQSAEANERLVELELLAFEEVRRGELAAARALLSGDEYRELKQTYSAGTRRALADVRARIASDLSEARLVESRNTVLLAILLPLLGFLWGHVFIAMRTHERARRADEARIHEYALELERTSEELRRAANARAEFLARMSHEIRTPMNGVLGSAELLGETRLDSEQNELLTTIRSSGAHLLGVIDDVLDVSKIEAGKLTIAPAPCMPPQVARDVLRLLRPTAESRGIQLELEVEPNAPGCVMVDPQRLRQILLNLVGNAMKFTERGTVTVVVSGLPGERDGRVGLELAVRDTGIGIAPENLDRVFRGFEQAEGSTARRFGGTGLGLTICKELTELMGGTLSVESELGVGSVFRMALQVELVPEAALPKGGARDAADIPTLSGARVLVVEDNKVNRAIAGRMLAAFACEVEFACDGNECLERVAERHFDVILMDCHMPVRDGFSAARAIREREAATGAPRKPIVALSASALPEDVQACRAAGMDDFVSKPIARDRLAETVRRWAAGGAPRL